MVRGLALGPKGEGRPTGCLTLPRSLAESFGVDSSLLRWHEVDAESMAPTYRRRDLVVVALRETVVDGAVHAVAIDGGCALRRVRARAGGGWLVTCDNPMLEGSETSPSVPVVGVAVLRIGPP